MNASIGNFALSFAVLMALLALMATIFSRRFNPVACLRAAHWLMLAHAGLLTLAAIALFSALINDDFSLKYISEYTEKALPIGYKLSAFWAGQQGSLLLWAWMLSILVAVFVLTGMLRRLRSAKPDVEETEPGELGTVAILAIICGFFSVLMLFANANPFETFSADMVTSDGHGLNPMLQNIGMIAHPPLLFLGYAAYTLPFALMAGAMLSGRRDDRDTTWLDTARPWSVVAWLFLTIGIVLGAGWAYVELGWGGYWAWDAVENASLLPWLTGTALLHSTMGQQHRGMLKRWNVGLAATTFILCIFGTYLTRSGVVQSVHAFGNSLVATFFLWFLIGLCIFCISIIAIRWKRLGSEEELPGLFGREGFFLTTNILLSLMMVATLFGTLRPLIGPIIKPVIHAYDQVVWKLFSQPIPVRPAEINATAEFYNTVVIPMAIVLVALMASGPLLTYGSDAARKLGRGIIIPLIMGIAAAVAAIGLGLQNAKAVVVTAICVTAVVTVLIELVRAVIDRAGTQHENPLIAIIRLIDGNHRRYGAQLAHVGLAMAVAGIAGSSLFSSKDNLTIEQGKIASAQGYTIRLDRIEQVEKANYRAAVALLTVCDPDGHVLNLAPEIRQFNKAENVSKEVAIRPSLRRDIYLVLAGVDETGTSAAVQLLINPLVSWIWVGGAVLSLGGLFALLPRFMRQTMTNAEVAEMKSKTAKNWDFILPGVPASAEHGPRS